MAAIGPLIMLVLAILLIASMWTIFSKAGQPGWASIVPIYNIYILTKITGRPAWWIILFFIPLVNLVITIIINIDLAKSFGKDALFGIGLSLLSFIFFPILAFGGNTYKGK